jgi:hypothetical protein
MGFNARDIELGEMLIENDVVYSIPRYQRPYSWGKEEHGNLWDDLLEAYYEKTPLFFGSVLLYQEEDSNEMQIVDGQQRFTTLTILFAAIRDELLSLGKSGLMEATSIQSDLIETRVTFGDRRKKLRVQEGVSEYFLQHYQEMGVGASDDSSKIRSIKRMKSSYEHFRACISQLIGRLSDSEAAVEKLKELTRSINNTRLIRIVVSDSDEAYSIFETVNARGSPLAPSDLIKNHIFRNIREDGAGVDRAKDLWGQITSNLTGDPSDAEKQYDLTKFIRYHWMSKYDFTTVKELYPKIKKSGINMDEFLEDLVKDSNIFGDMLNSRLGPYFSDPSMYRYYKGAEASLTNISDMNVDQSYVFILSLLRNTQRLQKLKDGNRPHEALKMIELFNFAYHVVCTLPANRVERLYSDCARTLEKSCNTPNLPKKAAFEALYSKLEELWPSEELFVEKFSDLTVKKSYKSRSMIRYIFSQLELYDSTGEMEISKEITIEHVLPQKPDKWGLTQKEVSGYVNSIGNLVLLSRPLNGGVGNKPLKEKLAEGLSDSELKITSELVDLIKSRDEIRWGRRDIEERAVDLAKRGYRDIWSV